MERKKLREKLAELDRVQRNLEEQREIQMLKKQIEEKEANIKKLKQTIHAEKDPSPASASGTEDMKKKNKSWLAASFQQETVNSRQPEKGSEHVGDEDTDTVGQPFHRLEEDRGMIDGQMKDIQVPHIIKTTNSSDVCSRFSTKKFTQDMQKEGIWSDLTDDGDDVHFSDHNRKKFHEIRTSMKTDEHNHRLNLPKVSEDLVEETISSKNEYITDSIEIPDDKMSGVQQTIAKFEREKDDVYLEVVEKKLIVYCIPDKIAEIMHKLKVHLGMIKLTGRQRRRLSRFSSLTPDIDSSQAMPSVDTSRQSHNIVPPRIVHTLSVNKARHCITFKVVDNLKVKVYEGDLLALNVDCIVNVVQTNGGPDTDLITKAAGEEVLKERERVSYFESLGEAACVITSAGQLKYKKLLHTTALEWEGSREEERTRENIQKSLRNCLMVADRHDMRSIGIPALLSGDLEVPKNICAEEYCRGVQDFADEKPNSLEEIHFIYLTGDMVERVSEIFAFRFTVDQSASATEEVQRTRQAPSSQHTPRNREMRQEDGWMLRGDGQAEQRRNIDRQRGNSGSSSSGAFEVSGIKVKVYSGNILQLDVACIVNAANETLEHGRGVAGVIARAAGKDFQQESYRYIQKHGHLQITDCISTSGGNLKYSHVLHAVGPRWRSAKQEQGTRGELRDTIVNTLLCAEQLALPSVGIPSISAGLFGVPKNVCAEEYGKGILQFIESHDPQVLKEVHFVDVAPDIVRVVSDTFNKMFAEESAPTPKSREEKTRREIDQESYSMPKEKFSNAPRKSNQMTSDTAVFLPQSTDDTLNVNSLQKPRPQNFSVSLSTSKQASGERLVTFRRSLSSDTSVPESNTSSWSMWNSDEQSPTDEGLLPKNSSLSGSQRAFKSRSSSVKDSPEQTSITEGLQPKDLSLSGSQRAYQSSNLARNMNISESGQSSQGKLVSEGRFQPITDVTSDKAEAAGYGSRKNPYIFYPFNNPRLSVFVYKHDIVMCKVDAVVSVLEIPGRESSRITQSVRKTVGAHNCPGRNEISKVRDLGNIVTNLQHKDVKLDYQYVIHANTPRWKSNEEKFKRELRKCIENVFKAATTGKCSIGSIAIPVLGLVGSSGPRPELCCEVMADAVVSFCANSSEAHGRLQEIHLIGYDEGLVYCLKEAVSAILDVPTSSSKIEGIFGVPKNVCAEEYGKGILQFIESHDPQVLKEVHFVDVAPDIVRVVSDTFNKMFAEESAPTPKSREEKTRRETDQESCSMPKEKFSNAPRKSNQMTSDTAVFLPQSTDDTLNVNSLQKPRPQNFSVSLSTSKQASGEKLVTFRRSLSSDTSVPESNTSSWSMWNSDEQSPTDEGLLPKDSCLSGSQRAFKSRSSSVKDSPEQTSITEGLQPKDLSLSGSQRAYQSSNLARNMNISESGQSSQGKLVSEGRLQPITDATSDKAEAAGYGSRKNPYLFYPLNNPRLSVFVYKHDIVMCKVDAVVSVLEVPGRESSRIAQSVRKTVGAHNCPGRNEISKVRDLENIVTYLQHKDVKLDYQYVIHANTPRWKSNEEKFKRELKKCIEHVFKMATSGKCSIGSIAIPVLGLVGSSGPRPELCCEVIADAVVSFCANSSEARGHLQEIHLIGYDEGLVYCLKEAVSAILDVPTSSTSKIEGDWQVVKKKGSHR